MERMTLVYFKEDRYRAFMGAMASLRDLFQSVGICH